MRQDALKKGYFAEIVYLSCTVCGWSLRWTTLRLSPSDQVKRLNW